MAPDERADPGVYRFGVFELDLQARELKKHGVRIKLQDQPLRILLLLVQHAGEVVTREQIQSELWPSGTYVDYENAINSSVRKLREALGDSPANPRFIETLSRRGYRLLVPVSCDGQALGPEEPRPAVRRWRWPVAATMALVIAAIAGLLLSRRQPAGALELPAAVPFVTLPGFVCCPSFSPDGTRVAFAWTGPNDDNLDIYVKLVGEGGPVRLTTDRVADTWPAWSPDGRWIAFERSRRPGASVLIMPALGGPAREVAHTLSGCSDLASVASLSWSADGKSLFAIDCTSDTRMTWITRISVDSGNMTRITSPDAAEINGDGAPVVSPDGTRLAFARAATGYLSDVYVLPLDTPLKERTARRISTGSRQLVGLAWTPDGRYLVFSADWRDRRALWRVPADGRSGAVAFTAGGNDSHEVAISPQGQLIYSTDSYLFQLWRLPIGHDSAGPAVRFLRSTRLDQFAQYSPDGKRIAFNSTRSGNNEIWVCNDDGSALMQLTSSATWSGTPRWSPDGLRIAFDSNSTGSWQIFVVNSRGGKPVQLTTNPHDNYIPSWSRDGNWIYFSSERTGRNEIWKIPSAGGRDIQLTRNGGYSGFETPSGTELYFTKNDGRGKLWRMCLPDRAEEVVAESVRGRTFEPGTRGVYFIEDSSAGATLRFLPYGSGPAITLASLGKALVVSLTVSPDEREAVYSRRVDTDTELMLVEGFGRKHGP